MSADPFAAGQIRHTGRLRMPVADSHDASAAGRRVAPS
jgi:hypothetical protein